ncbi:hypothetical protein [Neoroseomonas soli]|uniref:DUF3718 domain-containing protein n=1 Tax=Neoroseomonas soli TaxID=1081025 RepID=A0A9X9X399_9PROT|nr:hypothetical protein [Neoroseomonas soli]MBR0673878.1 hypothetical protein [Neoroseomonas soli]
MSRFHRTAILAALALAAWPAMAASVSTAWVQLPSNNQDECLSIGNRAVEAAGFRANISQDRQTVFGWRGEDSLTVRCISGHGVAVVFAWVGEGANDSGQLVDAVTGAYRNRGMVGGGNLGGGNLGGGNPGGGNLGAGNLGPGNFGGGPGGVIKR